MNLQKIDVFKAQIVRPDLATPWGFRLHKGSTHTEPLTVYGVHPNSPAGRIGVRAGDVITEIGTLPTEGMTMEQAQNIIGQYGDTILLTLERVATGATPHLPSGIPTQPLLKSYQPFDMTGATKSPTVTQWPAHYQPSPPPTSYEPEGAKFYQPYDMNRPVTGRPQPRPVHLQMQVAQSRPFDNQPDRERAVPAYTSYDSPARMDNDIVTVGPVHYVPEEEKIGGASQSKTFKILQSLMENTEQYSGVQGLPPPRSAAKERMKAELARQPGGRVKVFMPQKYNNPIDLYSARNVVDTFQQQAEGYLSEMDRAESNDSGLSLSGIASSKEYHPEASSNF